MAKTKVNCINHLARRKPLSVSMSPLLPVVSNDYQSV
jgi:hypothetical protein